MTAQVPERLLYRGMALDLTADPLRQYLMRLKKNNRPDFISTSTACWRGYIGTWEFREGMLCLVGLSAVVQRDGREVEADLDTVFPGAQGCLRATWLTDLLRCPEGRLVQYAHNAFASVYERDRCFAVRHGRLEQECVRLNPPPPLFYRIDEQGQRQCVGSFMASEAIDDPLEGRPFTDAHLVWGREPEGDAGEGYVLGGYVVRHVVD